MGHGIGVVLISPEGNYYPCTARLDFNYTNNIAEYEACVMRLQMTIEKKIETLEVYGDFTLVIYQLKGEWETRDSKLVLYQKHIAGLRKHFQQIQFQHVPREENQIADALATLATMFKLNNGVGIQPIRVQVKVLPVHCSNVEEEVDRQPWYYDIIQYIKCQNYPE
ncbi:uncharacterized protein LOC111317665 [Durio zibethinus]|uniref:Uncharacterized protein LOC111317665 n=1 Tax=Durio zibethinus TaxID=66656 RepID=A0A6P6BFJ5_DURZI|nr:uncharacterized protein LOC111317665 [Durio zibethinus]